MEWEEVVECRCNQDMLHTWIISSENKDTSVYSDQEVEERESIS